MTTPVSRVRGLRRTPANPLEDLIELRSALDDQVNRGRWRTDRKAREADLLDAESAHFQAGLRSSQTPAATLVDLHEQVEQAQGRAGLLALVEELAERTRLRVTATLTRPGPDGQGDTETLSLLAGRIAAGLHVLIADLATSDFVYPDEAHRSLQSALGPLTSRHLSAEATGELSSLRRWLAGTEFALSVVETAATRA